MPTDEYHRGIAYAVKQITPSLWEWAIFPPDCVKGFAPAKGVVSGTRTSAIDAAKREIEAQDIHCMN